MRVFMLLALLALLVGCGSSQSHVRITCGTGGGWGSFFGLGADVRQITHSDPDHVFTPDELKMVDRFCPPELDQLKRIIGDQ